MLDLNRILDQDHQTNTQRKIRWAWAWRRRFGTYPNYKPALLRECCICKKPLWIDPVIDIEPLKYTCSTKCDEALDELRRGKHWS